MGCGASAAHLPLGDLFATPEMAGDTPVPQKLQPESTPAEWLAFFDIRSPEVDAIVESCTALGAAHAVDVLLLSDQEVASMRNSLKLPIPRRKFDRALRGLRAAAKRIRSRERPGSAAAFRTQIYEEGTGSDVHITRNLSTEADRCPFCDHPRLTTRPQSPNIAPATPQASPSRETNHSDVQQGVSAFEAGRPSLQAPPWNPWQSVPYPAAPPCTAPTQYAGLAAGPLVNNAPILPPITSTGLHTTLPYFQQPYWLQTQQQQALLAATAAAQSQQWQNVAGWAPSQQANSFPSSLHSRPHSAAVTAQETAAAAALRRNTFGDGKEADSRRRKKEPAQHLRTPPRHETIPAMADSAQQQQADASQRNAADALVQRADFAERPWSATVTPAELKRKARKNIHQGHGSSSIGSSGGTPLDAVTNLLGSQLAPEQRQRRPQTADVHRPLSERYPS